MPETMCEEWLSAECCPHKMLLRCLRLITALCPGSSRATPRSSSAKDSAVLFWSTVASDMGFGRCISAEDSDSRSSEGALLRAHGLHTPCASARDDDPLLQVAPWEKWCQKCC
jgi:hypothetical protein